MTENQIYPVDKTENKPVDKGPQTDVVEEEKSKWEFAKSPFTIREMIALKVPPSEIFKIEGFSLSVGWISLIKMVNHKMISDNKINLDTNAMDGIKAYSACMSKSFF